MDYFEPNAKQHDTMFENRDGETFVDVSSSLGPDFLTMGFKRGSAFVDLNEDGFQDIIVTALNEPPRFLLSSGGNGFHWLLVDLVGTVSNRDAIGAEVKVTTGSGRTLYNHVSPSVGFMSSSERRVHFGLGKETAIRSVEVAWPSGKKTALTTVEPDKVVRIQEPR